MKAGASFQTPRDDSNDDNHTSESQQNIDKVIDKMCSQVRNASDVLKILNKLKQNQVTNDNQGIFINLYSETKSGSLNKRYMSSLRLPDLLCGCKDPNFHKSICKLSSLYCDCPKSYPHKSNCVRKVWS